MINDKTSMNKKITNKESLTEDLRRCLREKAKFHRQFYYRLSNDPETRSKIEKLSNQSSKLLQTHSQNPKKSNIEFVSAEKYSNNLFHNIDNKFSDKESINFTNTNTENHKPLKIQTYKPYDLANTNLTQQIPIQLNKISNEHVLKTSLISTPINPITNTLKIQTNDVNNLSILNDNQNHQLVMLPSLPNTLKHHENINKNLADVTENNVNVLNSSDHSNNIKMNQLKKTEENEKFTLIKEPILSKDLISINVGENIIHKTDTMTTLNNNNNIKYVSVVDKTNCNCDSILDYFGVYDDDRETLNNSDYSTILPATTINRYRSQQINNIELNSLNSTLKKTILSSPSAILESEINFSLLPLQNVKKPNIQHTLSSELLSSKSLLSLSSSSSLSSFDKLSNFYPNNCRSCKCSGSNNNNCCCTINGNINQNENTINSRDKYNNCSEQVDNSDGIEVQKFNAINRTILNQTLKDDNDGFIIKKRKRDLYRKFLKDQQRLEDKQKLSIRRKYAENQNYQEYQFPCVEKLINMYTKLLQDKKNEAQSVTGENKMTGVSEKSGQCHSDDRKINTDEKSTDFQHQGSPVSDEGCLFGLSPYSSDYEDTETDNSRQIKEKVARSSSSDSALGLDEEVANIQLTEQQEIVNSMQHKKGRRQTLTVTDIPLRTALLPVAEPTQLPDSPTIQDSNPNHLNALITQTAIPSKVLLEERVVEIPEDRFGSLSSSRRESAQSCMSDYNSSEYGGVRFVRTPSVVVSDYSDDVMCGITLEEIEYFRAQRMRRRSSADTATTEKDDACSDVSGSSSCSNLYYCGSTISALDGTECFVNGVRRKIDRKISDCSMCSTVSGEDDDDDFHKTEFQDQLNMDLPSQQHQNLDKDKQLTRKKVGH